MDRHKLQSLFGKLPMLPTAATETGGGGDPFASLVSALPRARAGGSSVASGVPARLCAAALAKLRSTASQGSAAGDGGTDNPANSVCRMSQATVVARTGIAGLPG